MQNRVTVTIAEQKYSLLASESQEYMERVAGLVDGQIRETLRVGGKLSLMEAAVLTAMNLADDYLKEQEITNDLRGQIQAAQEESGKLQSALSEAKRDVLKFQKQQETANNLRSQIKAAVEESAKLKLELSEAKREIVKLQNEKKKE